MKKILFLLTLLIPILTLGSIQPNPTGYVNDFANVIDQTSVSIIESKLKSYEDSTSIEITIVSVMNLNGISVEDYAQQLYTEWGIGKSETNAGLLILFSVEDRKWRLHTGYGLEPYLPYSTIKNIGDVSIPPYFRNQDYGGGIIECVNMVIDELGYSSWEVRENYLLEKKAKSKAEMDKFWGWVSNFIIGFLGLSLILILIYINYRRVEKNRKIKEKFNLYRSKIEDISHRIKRLTNTLKSKKTDISDSEYVPNRDDLLISLKKVEIVINHDILSLKPLKLFKRNENLKKMMGHYYELSKHMDDFLRLYSLNNDNIIHINTLKGYRNNLDKSNIMNKDKFLDKLEEVERGIPNDPIFDESKLKAINAYLKYEITQFNETYKMNGNIIDKYNTIGELKSRAEKFNGLNRDYLIQVLDNIVENFPDNGISKYGLSKTDKYLDMKISDFKRIDNINRGVLTLYSNRFNLKRDFLDKYRTIIREYGRMRKNYPEVIRVELDGFSVERKFYEERYLNNMLKLLDLSYKSLEKRDFSHADILRRNCGDIKSSFDSNLTKVLNLSNEIIRSITSIKSRVVDFSPKSGTLYSEINGKVGNKDVKTSTRNEWSNIQDRLIDFREIISEMDNVLLASLSGDKLHEELTTINGKINRDIRDAKDERDRILRAERLKKEEEARRKKKKEEDERRRRNSYSSTSSYSSGSSYSGGSSFGGFGGGRSGGGGASGSW